VKKRKSNLTVGIDFRRQNFDGIGRITNLIVEALSTEVDVRLILFGDPERALPWLPAGRVSAVEFNYPIISDAAFRLLPNMIEHNRVDVFIGPQFYVLPNLPCSVIIFLHDAFPFHQGAPLPSYNHLATSFGVASVGRLQRELGEYMPAAASPDDPSYVRMLYDGMYRMAVDRARRVVTVSETSRIDLCVRFPKVIDKVTRIYPYVATSLGGRAMTADVRPQSYVLHVSKWEPRKRQIDLINAVIKARRSTPSLRLVLVGDRWEFYEEYSQDLIGRIRDLAGDGWLRWYPAVSDAELRKLYMESRATVIPSKYEGFGLPAIEAMRLGSPIVSSGTGSLPEICGEAHFSLGSSIGALARALQRVWTDDDLCLRLSTAGIDRSARFSRSAFANGLLDVIEAASAGLS
jgi:glycosyltransferase involved in cell wall biosynthesis